MPNSNYVTAGKPKVSGAMFSAPLGTALPTDATSALNAAFNDLGYVSEDGVTNSVNLESTSVKDWGGNKVLTIQTSKDDQFKAKLIESTNIYAIREVYGETNATKSSGMITVKSNATELSYKSYVIDMALSNGGIRRIVLPKAKVSSVGEINYKNNDAVGYDITWDTALDSSGNSHYEYILADIVQDEFEGDGSTTAFTLSDTVGTTISVYVNNVIKTTGFTASGTNLTFTTAPADGDEIVIKYAV